MREGLRARLGRKDAALIREIDLEAAWALRPRMDEVLRKRKKTMAKLRPICRDIGVAAKKLLRRLEDLNQPAERILELCAERDLSIAALRADLEVLQSAIAPQTSGARRGPMRELDRVRVGAAVAEVLRRHGKKVAYGDKSPFLPVLEFVLNCSGLKDSIDKSLVRRSISLAAQHRKMGLRANGSKFSPEELEQKVARIQAKLAAKQNAAR